MSTPSVKGMGGCAAMCTQACLPCKKVQSISEGRHGEPLDYSRKSPLRWLIWTMFSHMIKYFQTGSLEKKINLHSDSAYMYTWGKKPIRSHRKKSSFFIIFPSLLLFTCPTKHVRAHMVHLFYFQMLTERLFILRQTNLGCNLFLLIITA